MSDFQKEDFTSDEYSYSHSYGFERINPQIIEAEHLKLHSGIAGFCIILFFLLRTLLPEWIFSFLFSMGLRFSLTDYTALSLFANLSQSLSVFLGTFIPFSIYMNFSGLKSLSFDKQVRGKSVYICAILICLGTSAFGALSANMITHGLSYVGVNVFTPSFTPPADMVNLPFYILNFAILPALLEEWAFRGVVLKSLQKFGDDFAIIVSSILFALAHANPMQLPSSLLTGLCLAVFVLKTGSIWTGVLLHFINNIMAIFISLLSAYISPQNVYYPVLASYSVYIVLSIFAIIYLSVHKSEFFSFKSAYTNITTSKKYTIYFTTLSMLCVLGLLLAVNMQYFSII